VLEGSFDEDELEGARLRFQGGHCVSTAHAKSRPGMLMGKIRHEIEFPNGNQNWDSGECSSVSYQKGKTTGQACTMILSTAFEQVVFCVSKSACLQPQ
jgi:hypothetical protein